MKPLQASSGDVLADRRADYAEMLFASGDHAPAADLLRGALELAPAWALGWFRLGEMYEAAGDFSAAAHAWETARGLDPQDRAGAGLKLALIGQIPEPEAPPSAFVEALFDRYADKFDASLVGKLGYRVPGLLFDALQAQAARRFRLALDLGCGTGLMGETLRPVSERLEGVDISAAMLRKARAKRLYDRLEKVDLQDFRHAGDAPDLVTAADVFLYIGDLAGVVAAVSRLLAPGGLFAFSVEKLAEGEEYALQPSRRYAHAEGYLRHVLGGAGLKVLSLQEHNIRQDRRQPVAGLIVVAARSL
jgi:predicted TPR repeat methyltransferase